MCKVSYFWISLDRAYRHRRAREDQNVEPTITSSRKMAEAVTERLLDWREEAEIAGRKSRADNLLLLAWRAFEWPSKSRTGRALRDAVSGRKVESRVGRLARRGK
jgi:hypothetical protein